MKTYYLNLTNGWEFYFLNPDNKQQLISLIPDFLCEQAKLVRIQSTWCEQKLWSRIIEDLDYSFLIDLYQGNEVIVIDGSSCHKNSRAVWQGLPWIKYCCERRWFGIIPNKVILESKGSVQECSEYFDTQYKQLSDWAKKKLDYIRNPKLSLKDKGSVALSGISFRSTIDK